MQTGETQIPSGPSPAPPRRSDPVVVTLVGLLAVALAAMAVGLRTTSASPAASSGVSTQSMQLPSDQPRNPSGGTSTPSPASPTPIPVATPAAPPFPTPPVMPWTPPTAAAVPTPPSAAPRSLPDAPAGMNTAGVRTAIASIIELNQTGSCYVDGAMGSAWPIGGDYYLTAAHVVSGATQVTADNDLSEVDGEMTGEPHGAVVVLYDTRNDVAIVEVPGVNASALPRAASPPSAGEQVAGVGLALGILSAAPMSVTQDLSLYWQGISNSDPIHVTDWLELTAGLKPGDSGGPTVDAQGEVVGINDAGDTQLALSVDITTPAVESDIATATGLHRSVSTAGTCPPESWTFLPPPSTPTPAPTPLPSPSSTPPPTPPPIPTPTVTPTPTPSPTPSPRPTPTPSPTPSPSPTPTPSPRVSPTPTPSAKA